MQKKMKALIAAGAAALAVGGGALVFPGSAQASECPDKMLCLYDDTSWGGHQQIITEDTSNLGGLFNDKTTSIRNYTDKQWCLYRDGAYRGDLLVRVNARTAIGNVGELANDKTTSLSAEGSNGC